jgi:ferredoxin
VESFTPLALTRPSSPAAGEVSFLASGRIAANTGLPLLEQAEDAGLTPAYGCRMGICNTCSTHKASGTVRNLVTGAVSGADDEQIRLCVCVPVGDVALDL